MMDDLGRRILSYLEHMGLRMESTHDTIHVFRYRTTVVMISRFVADGEEWCRVSSIVLRDVEPTLELLQQVLRLNTEVLYGAFLLFEDRTLSFSATFRGETLDARTFEHAVQYVAQVSARFDSTLQFVGGGRLGAHSLSAPEDVS